MILRKKKYQLSDNLAQSLKQSNEQTNQQFIKKELEDNNKQDDQQLKIKQNALKALFAKIKQNKDSQNNFMDLLKPKYFKQQWQNKTKNKHYSNISYYFRQNKWYLTQNILQIILRIVVFWFLSVFRVFGYQQNHWIFVFALLIESSDIICKFSYVFYYHIQIKKQTSEKVQINLEQIVINCSMNIYCIIYSILGMTNLINSTQNLYLLILDFSIILLVYKKIQQIFKDIKLISVRSQIKSYIKLVSLMSTLILIIHFFAILMFFASNFTDNFYLQYVQGFERFNWFQLYIYSIYFTGTTILTVGYGDILPRNIFQILIVLIMQVFGVVITVYLNGEVGNILFVLRRQTQNLYNDLNVLERLKSNFNLTYETTQKIRDYLINNRRIDEEKSIEQESNLLNKISSDLRQQAKMTNNLSLIKQCFFITSKFSIKAQLQISNKLIRYFYSPNQNILQIVGKQKLQIISKGEIGLYVSLKANQKNYTKKMIKLIKRNKHEKTSDNCFGYVSMIMGKPNRLSTFARDFSTCYGIQKKDFYDLINYDNEDFQKLHQMKQTFMNMRHPQQYQAQDFNSSKQHYVPHVMQTIKSYLKDHYSSKRKDQFIRNKRKFPRIYEKKQIQSESDQSESSDSQQQSVNAEQHKIDSSYQLSLLSQKQRQKKYQSMRNIQGSSKTLIVQRNYKSRYLNNTYRKMKQEIINNKQKHFQQPFQIVKSYNNYFIDFNIQSVLNNVNYYPKVLNALTTLFQNVLQQVNGKISLLNGKGSMIRKYRFQKTFLAKSSFTKA